MSQMSADDVNRVLAPAFKAVDELRIAIDAAQEVGDDQIVSTLIWAVCDVTDTIELINEMTKKNYQDQLASLDLDNSAQCTDLMSVAGKMFQS